LRIAPRFSARPKPAVASILQQVRKHSHAHASVTEVAHTVGFNDLARFDKLFKRHTGLTPSAYRATRRAAPSE
jgi:AraC-like DNA-binding protein